MGGEEGERKWGAPGGPKVQLNPTVAWPLEVVRLREAVPPKAQAEMNSFTEAKRKCEFNLDVIFKDVTMEVNFYQQGSPCELLINFHRQQPESHHESHCNLDIVV